MHFPDIALLTLVSMARECSSSLVPLAGNASRTVSHLLPTQAQRIASASVERDGIVNGTARIMQREESVRLVERARRACAGDAGTSRTDTPSVVGSVEGTGTMCVASITEKLRST